MKLPGRISQVEALNQGYTIDNCCNPPVAYKGPRFQPTEWIDCYTELEDQLRARIAQLEAGGEAEVSENCYVQPVPDHCDRITWRNQYYHLPLSPQQPAAPRVPEGYALVPLEPTTDMVTALLSGSCSGDLMRNKAYPAMLAAAPHNEDEGRE